MGAAKVRTDAVGHLLSGEQAGWLDDGALAMHPLGLDGIEPRTLDGQIARAGCGLPEPCRLTCLVVRPDPGAHRLADMPGGIVPDQDPARAHPAPARLAAAPVQKLGRDGTDGTTLDKAQPDRFAPGRRRRGAPAGRSRPALSDRDRLSRPSAPPAAAGGPASAQLCRCGWASRLHQTSSAKPRAQVRVRVGHSGSGGRAGFFSGIPRIGTGDPVLGPFPADAQPLQRLPNGFAADQMRRSGPGRNSPRRPDPASTGWWGGQSGVDCGATAPAAARPARAANAAGRRRLGREEPLRNAGRPCALKACRASSTVWSSQPSCAAIRGARSPRALASRIWHRRSTKASEERRPRSAPARSASVSGRTNNGWSHARQRTTFSFTSLSWH